MIISFDPDTQRYIGRCSFEDRTVFRRAKWEFDKKIKRWVTPYHEAAERLKDFLDDTAKSALKSFTDERQEQIDQSRALDTSFKSKIADGYEAFGFQNAGVEYALARKDTLIADDPGLGKTLQAICFANELAAMGECGSVLVLCESSQKFHWPREWEKFTTTGLEIGVVERKVRQKNHVKTTKTIWPDADVIVVNYDILHHIYDVLREHPWDLIIADECHALKTEHTRRTANVFGITFEDRERYIDNNGKKGAPDILDPIPAHRRCFLTGTPIDNRPYDLWPIVKAFDPDGLGADHDYFAKRYCGAYHTQYGLYTAGATNLDELQKMLRSRFMIRRTTEQALPDMPPKFRRPIFLPASIAKSVLREEEEVLADNIAALEQALSIEAHGDIMERHFSVWEALEKRYGDKLEEMSYEDILDEFPDEAAVALEEMAALRKKLALAKIPHAIEYLQPILEAGQKVVVFFYHKDVGQALKARWSNSCAYIDGSVASKRRQQEVDRFMEDEHCQIIFGQITAAGKGFTMTVSHRAVFIELDWRPGAMKQAENRIWRISQILPCMVDHLIIEGSMEVRQSQMLIEKQAHMDAALDNEEEKELEDA